MAGRGPLPKEHRQREYDTKRREAGTATVIRDGAIRGPALEGDFRPETLSWYETWRTSPQAQVFEATDWLRLALLAHLVNAYFIAPTTGALAEIRLNEERLGATRPDRLRARIRIVTPQVEESPALELAPSSDDARARMQTPCT
jgi:hypothetical protein